MLLNHVGAASRHRDQAGKIYRPAIESSASEHAQELSALPSSICFELFAYLFNRSDPAQTSRGLRIVDRVTLGSSCPYRKPRPDWRTAANRVMLIPDDRFSEIAGLRADKTVSVESVA
jgi:hypothetical protein